MTPEDLIEAAAKAAYEKRPAFFVLDGAPAKPRYTEPAWEKLTDGQRESERICAIAAASIFIEACAKEADALHSTTRADGNGSAYRGNVSAAIRALASAVTTEGK